MSSKGFTPALWNRIKSLWSCPSVDKNPASLPSSQPPAFTREEQESQSRRLKKSELMDLMSETKRCLQELISERMSKDQQLVNMRKSYAMYCHEYEGLLETYEQSFVEQSESISMLSQAVQEEKEANEKRVKQLEFENQQLKRELSASKELFEETCDMTEQLLERITNSVNGLINVCTSCSSDERRRQRTAERQSRMVLTKLRAWKSKKLAESRRLAARIQDIESSRKKPPGRKTPAASVLDLHFVPPKSPWPFLLPSVRHPRRHHGAFDSSCRRRWGGGRRKRGEEEEEEEVQPDESVSQIHCRSSFIYSQPSASKYPRSTLSEAKKNWTCDSSESGISLDRLHELLEL